MIPAKRLFLYTEPEKLYKKMFARGKEGRGSSGIPRKLNRIIP